MTIQLSKIILCSKKINKRGVKMTGLRKFWAYVLALVCYTTLQIIKDLDPISLGTAITMIVGVFILGNAAVHIRGKNETV